MPQTSVDFDQDTFNDLSDYFHGAPLGLHITSSDGTIRRTNLAELELLGYRGREDEYVGHHLAEFHADAGAVQRMLDGLVTGAPIAELEATLVRRDGTPQRVLMYANARMRGGVFGGIRCVTFPHPDDLRPDIAEVAALTDQSVESRGLRLTDREREELYEDLEDFFQNSPVNGHIVGGDGLIKHANAGEVASMGYPREAYVGQHIARFHADQRVIDGMLEDLVGGTPLINFSATLFHGTGSKLPVMIYSNSRMRGGSFVNTRCFTVPTPSSRRGSPADVTFAWPRNEDFGFTVASRGTEGTGPANPMTVALKYIASRKRPEESLGFLARVSETLGTREPFAARLRAVLALAVPFLADAAAVDMAGSQAVHASTPALAKGAGRVRERLGGAVTATTSADGSAELLELGIRASVVVPILIHEERAGVLTLVRDDAPARRPFGPADIALAEELARRLAFAIALERGAPGASGA